MYMAVKGGTAVRYVLSANRSLQIPEYQRDFAWGAKEGRQLFGDLIEHLDGLDGAVDVEPYYLGTIILTALGERVGGNVIAPSNLEVVDGQQRLITLTILLAILRDLEDDPQRQAELDSHIVRGGGGEFGTPPILQMRDGDAEFLFDAVQRPGATLNPPSDRHMDETRRNIDAVRSVLLNELVKMPSADRRILAQFVLQYCLLAVVTARSREQSYRIFTRANQRGKPLRRSDILKAAIIGTIPAAERAEYIAAWDEYKTALGENFDGEDKRRYLFSYISSFYSSDGNIIDNVLELARRLGGVTFMNEVFVPVAQAYLAVVKRQFRFGSLDERKAIDACLVRLSWLKSDEWTALGIQLVRAYSSQPAKLAAYLEAVERFSYGQLLLSANQYKLKVRRDPYAEAVRLAMAGGDLDLEAALGRTSAEKKIMAKALASFPERRAGKALLVRLAYEIEGRSLMDCDAMMREKDYEIEHVVPIRPQGDSDWVGILGAVVGQYARKTGNLFVVTGKLNDALANGDWSHKSRVLVRNEQEVIVPLGDHLRRARVWNAAAIDARHTVLVAAGQKLWIDTVALLKPTAKAVKRARGQTAAVRLEQTQQTVQADAAPAAGNGKPGGRKRRGRRGRAKPAFLSVR
jgi:hypothetical protein